MDASMHEESDKCACGSGKPGGHCCGPCDGCESGKPGKECCYKEEA